MQLHAGSVVIGGIGSRWAYSDFTSDFSNAYQINRKYLFDSSTTSIYKQPKTCAEASVEMT